MNVSIPPGQEHFVRAKVDAGRYRTASEVIREGLRLLEEREHLRLLDSAGDYHPVLLRCSVQFLSVSRSLVATHSKSP